MFEKNISTVTTNNAFSTGAVFMYGSETFGKLEEADSSPAVQYYENSSGVLTEKKNEGFYDITGTFVCRLVSSDSGYLLDGRTYIAAGSTFTLQCGAVRTTVLITSVGA